MSSATSALPPQLVASMLVGRPTECWPWVGARIARGYGMAWDLVAKRSKLAHRLAYEKLVGPIPEGSTLDHICHEPTSCAGGPTCPHRPCVNPAHLRPAAGLENTLRGCGPTAINAAKTECHRGHPFDEQNTFLTREGYRKCRVCRRARIRGPRRPAARR